MPGWLDVSCRNGVDLLLDDHAWEQCHHDRRGFTPPRFLDDVQEAIIVQAHLLLEAGYTARYIALATGATRGNQI